MKSTIIAVIAVLLVIGGIYLLNVSNEPEVVNNNNGGNNEEEVVVTEPILGCYVATLAKDVYSLKITSQNGPNVAGTLVFDNFEKDSSSGQFQGTYQEGRLIGNYTFSSEGTDSVMQVIFRKSGNNFVRGFGPVDSTGTKFTDLSKITYDPKQTFESKAACATSL